MPHGAFTILTAGTKEGTLNTLMAQKKTQLTPDQIREQLLKAGAKNLRDFGYPDVTEKNIMDSMITRAFFDSMLDENLGKNPQIDPVILQLKEEINLRKDPSATL